MGFARKLAGRVPVFFVGLGLILATGSYRGHEGSFQEMPIVGALLVLVGIGIWVGLAKVGD